MELCYADDSGTNWRITCRYAESGIAVREDGVVGLGCVFLARQSRIGKCLMVRKSARPGYEFSNLWAFPGGMVRRENCETEDLDAVVRRSLEARVRQETGVDLSGLHLGTGGSPLVTSYSVNGRKQHTLVLPFWTDVAIDEVLTLDVSGPRDPSVSVAEWLLLDGLWDSTAPANRLFAGKLVWPMLTAIEREGALPHLRAALWQCNQWAAEVALHSTEAPWLEIR